MDSKDPVDVLLTPAIAWHCRFLYLIPFNLLFSIISSSLRCISSLYQWKYQFWDQYLWKAKGRKSNIFEVSSKKISIPFSWKMFCSIPMLFIFWYPIECNISYGLAPFFLLFKKLSLRFTYPYSLQVAFSVQGL